MTSENPVTNDELLEAVSSYGESGNAKNERLVFLTPRLHAALVEHFRAITTQRDALGAHAYASSDKHLSGYRLTLGFDTLEQVQAAHQAAVNFGKALRARNGI